MPVRLMLVRLHRPIILAAIWYLAVCGVMTCAYDLLADKCPTVYGAPDGDCSWLLVVVAPMARRPLPPTRAADEELTND